MSGIAGETAADAANGGGVDVAVAVVVVLETEGGRWRLRPPLFFSATMRNMPTASSEKEAEEEAEYSDGVPMDDDDDAFEGERDAVAAI